MTALPRSGPVSQGVDPAAVLAFVDAAETDPDVELHSLMVLRHGSVVAEGWWAPHTPDRRRQLYSLSKAFTSMALGIAVGERRLGLDDLVVDHLPDLAADVTDQRSRAIRVRHLAAMASGHDREMLDEAFAGDPSNPVRGFLRVPPDADPGALFAYSQPCTLTLAWILRRVTGQGLTQYLRPRLLDPLGIGDVTWQTCPPGCEQGFSGLFARTEDVARLGLLLLQGGRWEGRQLVPAQYVAAASSRQVPTAGCQGSDSGQDWARGYGYQLWMSRHGFRGDGAFGQFCLVLPEHDAVVVLTAETVAMQAVLDHVWDRLVPGLGGGPVDSGSAAERALRTRLADLRLAPVPGTADRGDDRPTQAGGPASGATFTTATVTAGDDGPRLTLTDDGDALTVPVGVGRWRVVESRTRAGRTVPVAASGGWQPDGSFRAAVTFLETPHRLDVTCRSGGDAGTAWRYEMFGEPRLADLHRPADPEHPPSPRTRGGT